MYIHPQGGPKRDTITLNRICGLLKRQVVCTTKERLGVKKKRSYYPYHYGSEILTIFQDTVHRSCVLPELLRPVEKGNVSVVIEEGLFFHPLRYLISVDRSLQKPNTKSGQWRNVTLERIRWIGETRSERGRHFNPSTWSLGVSGRFTTWDSRTLRPVPSSRDSYVVLVDSSPDFTSKGPILSSQRLNHSDLT